jgi:hypothetical protein
LVFDDCDGVLKDATALMMFKGALDSYDERWVSWYAESLGDTDLPKTFKFTGRIIFISNMSMNKIDDAVKTRAFKIDVSMTAAQRIERMEAVLEGVMPHIDMPIKVDALNLVKELMNVAREVNFRALQRVITIRSSKTEESWKNLAKFSLVEG